MSLKVSVLGPGSMRLGRNHRTFVTLHDGRITTANQLTSIYPTIQSVLENANDALWEGIEPIGVTWYPPAVVYPNLFQTVLDSIRLHGHGGTLLVIPDSEWTSPAWRRLVRVKYSSNDTSIWPALLKLAKVHDD